MYNRILVPLDGSNLAEQALDHAVSLASSQSCKLHLLRVWSRHEPMDSPYPVRRNWKGVRKQCEAYLQRVANSLRPSGLEVWSHVLEGTPAEVINEQARSLDIDLIVMTSHGLSGISRWFLGSVAENVVRHAPCPVMTVGKAYLNSLEATDISDRQGA